MSHDDAQVREIDGHVVQVDGVPESIPGTRENRRPRMNDHRHTGFLADGVQGFEMPISV
jgi:hypothetical protein